MGSLALDEPAATAKTQEESSHWTLPGNQRPVPNTWPRRQRQTASQPWSPAASREFIRIYVGYRGGAEGGSRRRGGGLEGGTRSGPSDPPLSGVHDVHITIWYLCVCLRETSQVEQTPGNCLKAAAAVFTGQDTAREANQKKKHQINQVKLPQTTNKQKKPQDPQRETINRDHQKTRWRKITPGKLRNLRNLET